MLGPFSRWCPVLPGRPSRPSPVRPGLREGRFRCAQFAPGFRRQLGRSGSPLCKLGRSVILEVDFGLQMTGSAQFANPASGFAQFAIRAGSIRSRIRRSPFHRIRFAHPAYDRPQSERIRCLAFRMGPTRIGPALSVVRGCPRSSMELEFLNSTVEIKPVLRRNSSSVDRNAAPDLALISRRPITARSPRPHGHDPRHARTSRFAPIVVSAVLSNRFDTQGCVSHKQYPKTEAAKSFGRLPASVIEPV